MVVGFGGYVSGSAYIAAALLRKPIVIHDQNAKVGLANKLGAKFAKEVAVAYPNSGLNKARVVGNPLRAQIVKAANQIDYERRLRAAGVPAKFIHAVMHHDNSSTLNSGFHSQNDKTFRANHLLYEKKVAENDLSQGDWSLEIRRVNAWDR